MSGKDFNAGLFGGVVGVAISHPVDTVRIRIQTNQRDLFRKIYGGVTPQMFGVGLEKFLVFGNYEKLKSMQLSKNQNTNIIYSGMISGLLCTSVVTPIERLKINFQESHSTLESKMKILRKTTNIQTLYRGWSSTLIREVPGYGIYFGLYEMLKRETNDFKWYHSFIYGGVAGAGSWSVIYPSDVVKTRMQTEGNEKKQLGKCIQEIYREGGINRFYRGFNLAIVRAFMLHAGVFAGYEMYMKYA